MIRGSHVIDAVFGERSGRAQGPASLSRFLPRARWAETERVLLVEPDKIWRAHLREAVQAVADIDTHADFPSARHQLFSKRYAWLVTNSRLGEYNGLHLVHLAETAHLPIRVLVYADPPDLWLAREAQRVGAFYESRDHMERALPAYLRCALPPRDRRNPESPDRRAAFRGGRRCTDSSFSSFDS